jgi:methylglutaconyl-CoA hydratase
VADADFQRIRFEKDGRLAILTLNRPERRNALDAVMVAELRTAIARCDEDRGVTAILLRGEGPDFCAGADIEEMSTSLAKNDDAANRADAMQLGELLIAMRGSRVPIIAAVHGSALAGGAGLATAADMVVAAEDATFGYPEVHIGFVPAMVLALLRRAVGEKKAFELITLGERFTAAEARRIGMVARTFPSDEFGAASLDFAADVAGRSGSALELCKKLLYETDGMSFREAVERGADVNAEARRTDDFRDGVRRFLERRRR